MQEFYLITFKNRQDAIRGEKILKEKGMEPVVMPTPTSITKSCGISIAMSKRYFSKLIALYNEDKIFIKEVYLKAEGKFIKSNLTQR